MGYNPSLASASTYGSMKVGAGLSAVNGIVSTTSGSSNYGFFTDTTTQANPVANATNVATFNTTGPTNGVSVVSSTNITVANAGVYFKVFTLTIAKTSGGSSTISTWLQTGPAGGPFTDVLGSRQDLDLSSTHPLTFTSGNYTLNLAANSVIRLCWSSSDTTMSLRAILPSVSPVRPAGNSVKLTLTKIG